VEPPTKFCGIVFGKPWPNVKVLCSTVCLHSYNHRRQDHTWKVSGLFTADLNARVVLTFALEVLPVLPLLSTHFPCVFKDDYCLPRGTALWIQYTKCFFYHRTEHCDLGDIGRYAPMISCLRLAVRQYKILFV